VKTGVQFMKRALFVRTLIRFGLLLAAGFALWPSVASHSHGAIVFGEIFVVNSTGDNHDAFPGDGSCETQVGNGVCTLRAALEEVNRRNNGGDGISFDIPSSDIGCISGTNVCFIQPSGALPDIAVGVHISGPGSTQLFIDGGGDFRGFRVFNVTTGGTVSISGLTISDGYTTGGQFGAGIQNVNGGTINLTNCTLRRNQSEGASNPGGGGGGGIYNASTGTLNITNCVFRFNLGDADPYVGNGGGIWNKTGTVHISNSTFDHNQSSYRGGAISNEGGVVTVIGSTFYGNGAAQGGAISSYSGTVSVTNCTFYANIAYAFDQGVGGAIWNFNNSVLNLTNSTVTGNFSNYLGSGVANDNTFGAVANVKSTIIALNFLGTQDSGAAAPDVYGVFKSSGFNLIGKKDGSTGFTAATDKKGTVASPLNPKLDPKGLRDNGGPTQTVALVSGSPAIDKGTSIGLTGTLTTDQRGFARTVDKSGVPNATGGDGTDVGAFEFGAQ
jgi:CSLREA domain-containing protein